MPMHGLHAAVVLSALVAPVLAAQGGATPSADSQSSALPSIRLESFSVIVTDYDQAKTWYTSRLGFAVVRDHAFGGAGERFVLVAPPGQQGIGIVLQLAHSRPTSDEPEMNADYSDRVGKQVNIVLHSDDVSAYADSLVARGVALTTPVRQRPWGAQATFADLYGNSFVVVGPLHRRPADQPTPGAP